jgi:parallel beta-helix repeat protein
LGIFNKGSDYIIIKGNNISSNLGYGVVFDSVGRCNITNNTISDNGLGVYLSYSQNNEIANNSFFNNGLFLFGNMFFYYYHTIPLNNLVNGKLLYYYRDRDSLEIDGISIGQLILVKCMNINVKNIQIDSTDVAIEVACSTNINISKSNVSSNLYGVYLVYSDDNNITNNTISNNTVDGIFTYKSTGNKIVSNNITLNADDGINIDCYSHNNIVESNNIFNNTMTGINIEWDSARNNIVGNNISLNLWCGIDVIGTQENIIMCNNIFSNELGIRLWESINNQIYYNDIIDNTDQALDNTNNGNQWDNGYPNGGNYWSDYGGVDNFKGSNQNIQGSDGIGDTPYVIDADSRDNYPIFGPYKPLQNYTVLKPGWNHISIPLIQDEQNLSRVLGSIDGWYDAVQWYDVTDNNDHWKHCSISKPYGNNLIEINETKSFWIHITQPGETIFLYNGTEPTQNQTITLHPGWNMVGYPSLTSYNRTTGLNNLTFNTHVDAIWTYNAATQKYKELTASDYFEIGKGYYIHAKTESTWVVPL